MATGTNGMCPRLGAETMGCQRQVFWLNKTGFVFVLLRHERPTITERVPLVFHHQRDGSLSGYRAYAEAVP